MKKIVDMMDSAITRLLKVREGLTSSCDEQRNCIPCLTGNGECDDGKLLIDCMAVIDKAADYSLEPEDLSGLREAFNKLAKIRNIKTDSIRPLTPNPEPTVSGDEG